MARRPIGISAKWLKYFPQLAAVYAFYEYYAAVGVEGIKADLEALTFEGIKAQAQNILSGLAAFLIGDVIASRVKDKYIKTIVRTIAYYVGAKQIAGALDAGSTVSRQVEATKPAVTHGGPAISNAIRGY
ncbi:hypothetical protein J2755_000670 [Methanohalophilus levihalophilus]|uniref:hypothetical protein n=1 Tax=Methanohalophilus levihalophilus TaxID=1431282 RepID=UPI001AE255E7|nr:hypothetical protein [Methanohalophilus levihalophilus]MBP2029750.1 hypothetical protein [Methanohalophilus levihalophilus]